MDTTAEATVDETAKYTDSKKHPGADMSGAMTASPKNIMFPSLSDEMLLKIVEVRCYGDASKQSR